MKRFLKRIAAFLLVFIIGPLIFFGFNCFVVGNQYDTNYMGSVQDKIARLNSLPSPKVILVGNSNVAFGFESKLIEEALGMPVVNLGLHGGVGNAFLEEMAKVNIGEGDLVIHCPTNFADEDAIGDATLVWSALEYNWELWKIPRLKDWGKLIPGYPEYAMYAIKRWTGRSQGTESAAYTRSVLNEYGDVYLRPDTEQFQFVDPVEPRPIDDTFIRRTNAFHRYTQKKGAQLLIAGYPIGYGELTAPTEDFIAFQQTLESRLDCPVISDYTDYFIPYELYYDTAFHLSEEGARIRTMQLIEDIQTWMQEG